MVAIASYINISNTMSSQFIISVAVVVVVVIVCVRVCVGS